MTRAHVRLLGPCFKTGRVEDRPIRHRPFAPRAELDCHSPAVATHCKQSATVEQESWSRGPLGTAGVLGPAAGPHRRAVTPSPRGRSPSQRASDCAQNRSWHSARRKCTLTARQAWCAVQEGSSRSTVAEALRAEFPGLTLRIHPFDSIRFHVLLNSLFKVLFNFPSRYLSAIGLVPVFSLRWSLPPTLGCILKQPDSKGARSRRVQRPNGPDTRYG